MSNPLPLEPGDVGTVEFAGARVTKRRPVVVVSSRAYQSHRPDVIVGLLTSNLAAAATPMDCLLENWHAVGLRRASAFRSYLQTVLQSEVQRIGRLSERDWAAVRACLSKAFEGD